MGIPNRMARHRSVGHPATVGDVSLMRVRRYQREIKEMPLVLGMIPGNSRNAFGIEGGDRLASLSGRRGNHKWEDL